MSARTMEYKQIIEDLVANLWLLEDDEKQALAALLSTAESAVLAKMASEMSDKSV